MNRSTLLLIGLLVVLGAVVYLFLPSEEEQMTSYTRPDLAFAVDSASVARVEIRRPGETITLANIGGRWTITSPAEYPADPAAVSQLIGSFSRFRPGSLISSNAAKQELFNVDSGGTTVTFHDRSGQAQSIIIGKMGPSFSEVYFRLPGQADVYLGSGITAWSLNKDVKEWRDRTVYAAPSEAITGVTISLGSRSREFTRDSTGWKSGGALVENETINPVLTALSKLRADDFIDSAMEFRGTPASVTVRGASDATMRFYRLPSDTSKYAVLTSASPQKFIVSSYTASQLLDPVGLPAAARVSRPPQTAEPEEKTPAVATGRETKREAPVTKREATPPSPPVRVNQGEPDRTRTDPEPAAANPFRQRDPGERKPAGEPAAPVLRPPETKPPASRAETKPPAVKADTVTGQPSGTETGGDVNLEEEGELKVHVVKRGETMSSIARQYGVSVEQILKWNLLKSISISPGQELYVFVPR